MPQKKPTNWVGWVYFASAMMVLAGCMQAISGLVALLKDDYYVVTNSALLAFNYTTWGWVHLGIGVLLLAAGFALWAGSTWAIATAVVLSILSALANIAFLSSYPIWSIIAITVNILIIYSLMVHGTEVRET